MADRFAPWPVQTMIVSRNEALTPLFLTLNFRRPGRDELTFPSGSTAGARLAVREPCSASGPVARPGSDWTSTSADEGGDADLRLARALHVYVGAALFASLAILAAAAGLRAGGCGVAWGRRGLAPRKHLAALALLLVAVGAANCAALICEVFAEEDRSSSELLANVVLPCVPAAFALFLFVVMQVSSSCNVHSIFQSFRVSEIQWNFTVSCSPIACVVIFHSL